MISYKILMVVRLVFMFLGTIYGILFGVSFTNVEWNKYVILEKLIENPQRMFILTVFFYFISLLSYLINNYITPDILVKDSITSSKTEKVILQPFEDKDIGIIVSEFNNNFSSPKYDGKGVQKKILSTLIAQFTELNIDNFKISSLINYDPINSHNDAISVGLKLNADLVIWGDINLQGILPNITVVKSFSALSYISPPNISILKDTLTHIALEEIRDIRFPDLTGDII